jgi:hypothetical protein
MSKRLIYALFILGLLTACNKRDESELNKPCTSGCAVFHIRVGTGDSSAQLVGGAKVDLVWQGPNGIFGGGGKSIDMAKGYTDGTGMIHMKFKAYGDEFTSGYFNILVTGPDNYIASSRILFGIRNADTTLTTSVQLPLKAYMKIVLKNFDPVTPDDSFAILPTFNTYGSTITDDLLATSQATGIYTNTLLHTGQSAPFDSLIYEAPTAGNQYTRFSVVMHRNGVQVDRLDSIYIPKGTTGTYRVDYQHSFQ